MDFSPISSLLCSLSNRQYPKIVKFYLQALLSGGYGYGVIEFGDSLLLCASIKLDDVMFILKGLPSDVLPCLFLPVDDANKCSPTEYNNNS
jgi:hypothetical protein